MKTKGSLNRYITQITLTENPAIAKLIRLRCKNVAAFILMCAQEQKIPHEVMTRKPDAMPSTHTVQVVEMKKLRKICK